MVRNFMRHDLKILFIQQFSDFLSALQFCPYSNTDYCGILINKKEISPLKSDFFIFVQHGDSIVFAKFYKRLSFASFYINMFLLRNNRAFSRNYPGISGIFLLGVIFNNWKKMAFNTLIFQNSAHFIMLSHRTISVYFSNPFFLPRSFQCHYVEVYRLCQKNIAQFFEIIVGAEIH